MARICAGCREPVYPVNECVCPDDPDETADRTEDED